MKSTTLILFSACLSFCSVNSFAQEQNSWGDVFDCAVDWFSGCVPGNAIRERETDKPKAMPANVANTSSLLQGPNNSNLPAPVRNVLENPSPETASAYVAWSRQANEKLAKASEYIAQAMREMNSEASTFRNRHENSNNLALAGVGPVGLYYFFSPSDQSAGKDVAVLNKIFREGRLGVVGIPVGGKDDEIVNYVNETKPLFPIRRSDAEVKLVKATETPDLYLALPLEKKMFRLGPTITETAITEAIGKIMAGLSGGKSILDSLASDR
jgi:hypothetical protein